MCTKSRPSRLVSLYVVLQDFFLSSTYLRNKVTFLGKHPSSIFSSALTKGQSEHQTLAGMKRHLFVLSESGLVHS